MDTREEAGPSGAVEQARALLEGVFAAPDPEARERCADRIEALLGAAAPSEAPEVAALFATALAVANSEERDPSVQERRAARIEGLL
ncbi:MAG TPA: hypothetical protein VJP77_04430, partial [Planctomycetota bacterium]|nr:hypothetical protein [Planctomycetota bacterium]